MCCYDVNGSCSSGIRISLSDCDMSLIFALNERMDESDPSVAEEGMKAAILAA